MWENTIDNTVSEHRAYKAYIDFSLKIQYILRER